jgi:ribosome modulation factor
MDTDEFELSKAWREGYLAFINGEKNDECPYDTVELCEAWREGWRESQYESQ